MKMFWNIILLVAMVTVGGILYSFGVLQILISMFTTIPLTEKISKHGDVNRAQIYKRMLFTIFMWGIIVGTTIALTFVFGNSYARIGLIFGMLLASLFSVGNLGPAHNAEDYIRIYGGLISPEAMERFLDGSPNPFGSGLATQRFVGASNIAGVIAGVAGIVSFYLSLYSLLYICASISVLSGIINVQFGEQRNLATVYLAAIIGLVIAVIGGHSVVDHIAVAICYEQIILLAIPFVLVILALFPRINSVGERRRFKLSWNTLFYIILSIILIGALIAWIVVE